MPHSSTGSSRSHRSFSLCSALALLLALGCDGTRKPDARPAVPAPLVQARIETPARPPPPSERVVAEHEDEAAPVSTAAPAKGAMPASSPVAEGDDALSGLVSADAVRAEPSLRRSQSAKSKLSVAPFSTTGTGAGYGYAGGGFRGRQAAVAASAPPMVAIQGVSPEMNTERYSHATDNTFQLTKDSPLSTFSIDVDTASYANVRRYLRDGSLPPADAVRIEELVNYFSYAYPEPRSDDPVSVTTEVAAAPWAPDHRLVRIGLRTKAIDNARAPASNLVFLIDVSGSMESPDKLPLLKRGLSMLAENLRGQDRVAMVVYAGASGVVLPSTAGSRRAEVIDALDRLHAGGSTNGADGIRLAYRVARQNFIQGGTNRVILATDGDFNVGTTSEGELVRLIEEERKSGVFLTVLGFGSGNLNDSSMEKLADHGNGSYAYVDSIAEAHKVLVREAGSTLVTVAKDVKLQIEWNPARVASYRLIGFENRVLAARDFNDDKKDAGELGAGHSMTALYEIVPLAAAGRAVGSEVDPLKYSAQAPTAAAQSDELLTLKLRYKRPDADVSRLMSQPVKDAVSSAQGSSDLRWAAAVACFGMLLRDSEHKGQATVAMADSLARGAVGADPEGHRHEFVSLIEKARALGLGVTKVASPSAQLAK